MFAGEVDGHNQVTQNPDILSLIGNINWLGHITDLIVDGWIMRQARAITMRC